MFFNFDPEPSQGFTAAHDAGLPDVRIFVRGTDSNRLGLRTYRRRQLFGAAGYRQKCRRLIPPVFVCIEGASTEKDRP
jgi:hypothetical protein